MNHELSISMVAEILLLKITPLLPECDLSHAEPQVYKAIVSSICLEIAHKKYVNKLSDV